MGGDHGVQGITYELFLQQVTSDTLYACAVGPLRLAGYSPCGLGADAHSERTSRKLYI